MNKILLRIYRDGLFTVCHEMSFYTYGKRIPNFLVVIENGLVFPLGEVQFSLLKKPWEDCGLVLITGV